MKNYRSTIIGFAVLVVLLSAGAAQSLSGSNTVFSDDIAPGQVGYSDIKDSAVGSMKIYNNSVTGTDVNESTLNMAGNCGSPGLIQGNVIILGSHGAAIPTEFQEGHTAFPYNCSGGRVLVKRYGAGAYGVKFENNAHQGALASPNINGAAATAQVYADGPGQIAVNTHLVSSPVPGTDMDVAVVLW